MRVLLCAIAFVLFSGASQAQIATVTASPVIFNIPPAGVGKSIIADGTASLLAGETPFEIVVERGTIANGVFTGNGTKSSQTFGGGANQNWTWSVNFAPTALPVGTHSVKAVLEYNTNGVIPGQRIKKKLAPVYSTTSIQ
ncbi:MAG: hypothetical protein ACRC8S_06150 [Fimbriiglobus sp.]